MIRGSHESRHLTKQQRIGWIVISILVVGCLAAMLIRHKSHELPDTPIQVTIHPITADTCSNSVSPDSTEHKSKKTSGKKKGKPKSGKSKKAEQKAAGLKQQMPDRDITTEIF